MLINEVSKTTGLTKKAIEYYTQQGLIAPHILKNGYRDFSHDDIERLHKIFILRRLGVGTEDIKTVLSGETKSALQAISIRKELDLQREQAKKFILDELNSGKIYSEVRAQLEAIDQSQTITEKLLDAFPGYFGRFISLHFAQFLNEPIVTPKQQVAYDTVLSFLDNTPPQTFPHDLQVYLIESTQDINATQILQVIDNTRRSIDNPEEFLTTNKELLDRYLLYRQSEEYKNSPAYKAMQIMKELNHTSGYNDVFIPALKELSSSYCKYTVQLQVANEKLLAQYPQLAKLGY